MSVRQLVASALLAVLLPSFASAAPVLRWTFDEASGDALDTGVAPPWAPGSVSNGVLTGGAARSSNTPGGRGSSVDLRNDSPYAHVLGADADKLERFGSITITTWLNVEQYTSGGPVLASKYAASNQAGNHPSGFYLNMHPPIDGAAGPDNFQLRSWGAVMTRLRSG